MPSISRTARAPAPVRISPPSSVLGPDYLPESELNQVGPTEDDVSLLWLKPGASTTDAVSLLESNATAIGLGQILYGPQLAMMFNQPGLPADGGGPTDGAARASSYCRGSSSC